MAESLQALSVRIRSSLLPALTVVLVATPLCLGIAHASGAPLVAGLLSGIIGGLLVGLLSDSPLSVSGPVAGMTAIVLAATAELGSFSAVTFAIALAGLMQIVLGWARLGFIVRFFPSSVIKGMLAAIGVILMMKQFPHLIGYDIEAMGVEEFVDRPEDVLNIAHAAGSNTLETLMKSLRAIHSGAFTIGMVSLSILFLWNFRAPERLRNAIPASLLTVLMGTILATLLTRFGSPEWALSAEHSVQVPSLLDLDLTSRLHLSWDPLLNPRLYWTAFVIALVGSIETLVSIEATDRMDPMARKTSPNRELLAQGAGNFVSGVLGGLPITSAVVRSTINLNAGAKSKESAVLQGLFLLIAWFFFTPLLNTIPIAALAAVLAFTGLKLASPPLIMKMWRKGASVFVPFATTLVLIPFTDLLVGLAGGFAVAVFFILKTSYEDSAFDILNLGRIRRITLGKDASFLQKARLTEELNAIPDNITVEIDGSHSSHIDPDIVDVIERFKESAVARNIQVITGGIKGMENSGSNNPSQLSEEYQALLRNNLEWVKERTDDDPQYFSKLSEGQTPHFLVIGCSDSRVPVETITKTDPGAIFLHRNIANIVSLSDINLLSVLQYSVEVLNVRHIVVLGHYGCGGVRAALGNKSLGLIDNWISSIKHTVESHAEALTKDADPAAYERHVIELSCAPEVGQISRKNM